MTRQKKMFRLGIILVLAAVFILAGTVDYDTIRAKKILITGSGGLQFRSGAGTFDLNGKELILDAGGGTSFTADTNNQVDIEIDNTDEFVFTAGGLDIAEGTLGRIFLDANKNTSFRSRIDDELNFEMGGSDEITMTTNLLSLNDSIIRQDLGTENVGQGQTILTVDIAFGAAAGSSGTIATIAAGEIWLVHSVFISVTTNFDATGDDATLTIGDDLDPDGFINAADANLQITFTEATGFAAGYFGIENGSAGAYSLDDGGPFIYDAAQTIDFLVDETSGETLTAGEARVYVIYTRIQ